MSGWLAFTAFVLAVIGFFFAFLRYFHRIPRRNIPPDSGCVISPADGRIWQVFALNGERNIGIPKRFAGKIETWAEDVEDACTVVSIFMNPLDAHVNWMPVNGKIIGIRHTPGNFSMANSWKSLLNEKNEILIQGEGFQMKMIQIAGFLARRIECWKKEDDMLAKGDLVGMIRLGSQVSLIFPKQVSVLVKVGQKVRGGETILGKIEGK